MSNVQYREFGEKSDLAPARDEFRNEWPKKIRALSTEDLDRLTIDSAGRFYWDGKLVNYGVAKQPATGVAAVQPVSDDPDARAAELLDRAAHEIYEREAAREATRKAANAYARRSPELPTPEFSEFSALPASVLPSPPTETIAPAAPAPAAAPTPAPQETPPAPSSSQVEEPRVNESVYEALTIEPVPEPEPAPQAEPVAVSEHVLTTDEPMMPGGERLRFSLTGWQSFAVVIALFALSAGACGILLSSVVAAHEWGCRTKLVTMFCPAPPVVAPEPTPKRPIIN